VLLDPSVEALTIECVLAWKLYALGALLAGLEADVARCFLVGLLLRQVVDELF